MRGIIQRKIKIVIDIAITVLLLALMSYELIGAATHEWLGISIFLLFILHHVLNRKWLGSMGKGKREWDFKRILHGQRDYPVPSCSGVLTNP